MVVAHHRKPLYFLLLLRFIIIDQGCFQPRPANDLLQRLGRIKYTVQVCAGHLVILANTAVSRAITQAGERMNARFYCAYTDMDLITA